MSAAVTLDVADLARVTGAFDALAGADTLPLMQIIAQAGEAIVSENFEGEHDPDGYPWFPSMAALAEGRKTLTKRGFLSGSIASNASANEAEVGTNLDYARAHQEGFTGTQQVGAHKRTIRQAFGRVLKAPIEVMVPAFSRNFHTPARPFLGWGAAATQEAHALAEDFLTGLLPAGAVQ